MAKTKILEIILTAASALIAAAKSIFRFFACLGKMKPKTEPA